MHEQNVQPLIAGNSRRTFLEQRYRVTCTALTDQQLRQFLVRENTHPLGCRGHEEAPEELLGILLGAQTGTIDGQPQPPLGILGVGANELLQRPFTEPGQMQG